MMDYRKLLTHYMRNVRQHAGTDFLYPRHTTSDETRDDWTDQEWLVLTHIQRELDEEPLTPEMLAKYVGDGDGGLMRACSVGCDWLVTGRHSPKCDAA